MHSQKPISPRSFRPVVPFAESLAATGRERKSSNLDKTGTDSQMYHDAKESFAKESLGPPRGLVDHSIELDMSTPLIIDDSFNISNPLANRSIDHRLNVIDENVEFDRRRSTGRFPTRHGSTRWGTKTPKNYDAADKSDGTDSSARFDSHMMRTVSLP